MIRVAIMLSVIGIAAQAGATVLPNWDLGELISRADAVVVARVESFASFEVDERVLTDYRLAVERVLLGAPRAHWVVTQLGGEMNGIVTEVLGTAALQRGRRYLLILRRGADGRTYPVGMALGVWAVDGERLSQGIPVPLLPTGGVTALPISRQSTLSEIEQVIRGAQP